MDNIGASINLRQFVNIVTDIKGKGGKPVKCIVLPIEANNFITGEEGKGIYVNLIGFPIKERKADKKETHIVKQSFPKEVREKMTEEQTRALPILGNFTDWANVPKGEAEPNTSKDIEVGKEPIALDANGAEDDLPF